MLSNFCCAESHYVDCSVDSTNRETLWNLAEVFAFGVVKSAINYVKILMNIQRTSMKYTEQHDWDSGLPLPCFSHPNDYFNHALELRINFTGFFVFIFLHHMDFCMYYLFVNIFGCMWCICMYTRMFSELAKYILTVCW